MIDFDVKVDAVSKQRPAVVSSSWDQLAELGGKSGLGSS